MLSFDAEPPPTAPLSAAMLSHDSATELTIEPTEGFLPVRMAEDMMQGEGRDPSRAPLRVVFAPLMYGTRKTGRLVVQAGADQYTYNIVGKLSSETMRRKKIQSTIQTSLQDAPPKAVAIRQSKDMDGAGAATFARRQKVSSAGLHARYVPIRCLVGFCLY